jgi:hypothetical protein
MTNDSTRDLINAALVEQALHRAGGWLEPYHALYAVQRLGGSELVDVVRELQASRNVAERLLGARLLNQPKPPLAGTTILELVREALQHETDGEVINWLVIALQYGHERSALPDLKQLAKHPDATARFVVPDALSACSENFGEIDSEMLELSKDRDRDVRWSAAFELAAWMRSGPGEPEITADQKARVVARLAKLAADDDAEIRSVAVEGLKDAASNSTDDAPPLPR